jgi:hypothetical protein
VPSPDFVAGEDNQIKGLLSTVRTLFGPVLNPFQTDTQFMDRGQTVGQKPPPSSASDALRRVHTGSIVRLEVLKGQSPFPGSRIVRAPVPLRTRKCGTADPSHPG